MRLDSQMEHITLLKDPASGKAAVLLEGTLFAEFNSLLEAAEAVVAELRKGNMHPIVLKSDDGTVLETLYADTALMIEWARFSADSGDYYGSSVSELCELAEYCRWRFEDTLNPDYTPGASLPARPDPSEWYMIDAVNEVSKAEIEAYTAALTAVYEACKRHNLDY